jgi:hypothetical protein
MGGIVMGIVYVASYSKSNEKLIQRTKMTQRRRCRNRARVPTALDGRGREIGEERFTTVRRCVRTCADPDFAKEGI